MVSVALFHHVQGLTPGVLEFAETLRAAGHDVVTPDLFGGRTFPTIEDGVAFAEGELGTAELMRLAGAVTAEVYAGFSLGATAAQYLAQTRPDARGALLYEGAIPPRFFDVPWPAGKPAQVHVARDDPWAPQDEYDLFVQAAGAELYLYDAPGHLFADSSLDSYDPAATEQLVTRTLGFLRTMEPTAV
jgi:dienelactone hydrolase